MRSQARRRGLKKEGRNEEMFLFARHTAQVTGLIFFFLLPESYYHHRGGRNQLH